jgi:hypothetical protein
MDNVFSGRKLSNGRCRGRFRPKDMVHEFDGDHRQKYVRDRIEGFHALDYPSSVAPGTRNFGNFECVLQDEGAGLPSRRKVSKAHLAQLRRPANLLSTRPKLLFAF